MASHSHLQIFAPPQDWKTMALNPLMLDNAYSNSALVITPKLNLRQFYVSNEKCSSAEGDLERNEASEIS